MRASTLDVMLRRPSQRPRRLLASLLVAAVILGVPLALRSHWEVTHTKLATLDLTSPKITGRPLRIMQVTDVHNLPRESQRDAIVAMVREQAPDLIAVTGDLESVFTKDLAPMDDFVGDLAAIGIPVYYIPGNHENDNTRPGNTTADVVAMIEKHGGTALINRHVTQDGPWGTLDVIGTDDYYKQRGDLPKAMEGTRPDAYHFVLTHSPQAFDALSVSTADLAVCGHTHGGQVRLPWIGALYAPGGGFMPRLDKGLFDAGNAKLYIDSGVGASSPLRLNDQSQVTLITIRHP